MRAGAHALAVYAAEADGVVEWREPVPLPHAPAAVLGVVSVRGRMRTVLDPAALLGAREAHEGAGDDGAHRFVVVLRGDEQLALAVAHAEPINAPADLAAPDPPLHFLRATFRHDGQTVHLLNPAHLFAAATQGADRRRKRSDE